MKAPDPVEMALVELLDSGWTMAISKKGGYHARMVKDGQVVERDSLSLHALVMELFAWNRVGGGSVRPRKH